MSGPVLAGVAVVFWSTNAVAAKAALAELTVAQVLALQFAGAALTLIVLQLVSRPRRHAPASSTARLWALGIIGIVGTISFQYLAFRHSPIVQANIIAYGWPLFAAIWWGIARRSGASVWFVLCAALGFAGVALIMGNGQAVSMSFAFLGGYLFALASALCMAFYTLAAGRLRDPGPAVLLPALGLGFAGSLFLTIESGAAWPTLQALLLGLYIGIGPMALGYFLWMRAMSGGNPAAIAQLGFVTPLLSTLWLFVAGETLSAAAFAGGVLVIGASTAAMLLDRSERRRRSSADLGTRFEPRDAPAIAEAQHRSAPALGPGRETVRFAVASVPLDGSGGTRPHDPEIAARA
ncbi:MAG TPA: DMT family transporter [Kiloniellales bacterium]|nr:DMT family transporter [Kiloniellales bacterium]